MGGAEFEAGAVESLAALHAAVPAAEALDLSGEAYAERMARRFDEAMAIALGPSAECDATDEEPDDEEEPDEPDPLTLGQTLGLLEHELGADEVEE